MYEPKSNLEEKSTLASWNMVFLKNIPIYFQINSTSDIRSVKRNELSFFSIDTYKPLSALVHIDEIQVQKPILVVVTDQIADHI